MGAEEVGGEEQQLIELMRCAHALLTAWLYNFYPIHPLLSSSLPHLSFVCLWSPLGVMLNLDCALFTAGTCLVTCFMKNQAHWEGQILSWCKWAQLHWINWFTPAKDLAHNIHITFCVVYCLDIFCDACVSLTDIYRDFPFFQLEKRSLRV